MNQIKKSDLFDHQSESPEGLVTQNQTDFSRKFMISGQNKHILSFTSYLPALD